MRSHVLAVQIAVLSLLSATAGRSQTTNYEFNDSHVHLTNNIQEGPTIRELLNMMSGKANRVAVFGIPLQQQWSYRVDGDRAPTYYLHSDAPLYYYSFTDAFIAMAYKSLPKEQQARFDPMITGFNPSDMYAADHIRRVLQTFPGVFTGIGEFTIHKEFVSAKIPGEVASLQDPALDRLLAFCGDAGLVVLIHNDIDVPFAKEGSKPAYLEQMKDLFKRHANVTFIWAHTGLGRVVRPTKDHVALIEEILRDPGLRHVNFDISWTEVAKYFLASPRQRRAWPRSCNATRTGSYLAATRRRRRIRRNFCKSSRSTIHCGNCSTRKRLAKSDLATTSESSMRPAARFEAGRALTQLPSPGAPRPRARPRIRPQPCAPARRSPPSSANPRRSPWLPLGRRG
jgi:hypothetical protein